MRGREFGTQELLLTFAFGLSIYIVAPQYSDSDSEADFSAVMVPPVPSAVPVTGESYCGCDSQADTSYNPRLRGFHQVKDCHCGEDDQGTRQLPHDILNDLI